MGVLIVLIIVIIIAVIATIIFAICLFSLSTAAEGFEKLKQDYHNLKEVIETQRTQDYNPLERVKLTEEIIKANQTITAHKVYCTNVWVGIWYSKEVGDLPILK